MALRGLAAVLLLLSSVWSPTEVHAACSEVVVVFSHANDTLDIVNLQDIASLPGAAGVLGISVLLFRNDGLFIAASDSFLGYQERFTISARNLFNSMPGGGGGLNQDTGYFRVFSRVPPAGLFSLRIRHQGADYQPLCVPYP